jgi:hypothetical protein
MIQNCAPLLTNNTITQNRCTNTTTAAKGGGLYIYSGGPFSGVNNILYDNYATLNPEFYGTVNFNYSCSPVSLSGTGNITSNPMFLNPGADNFHLSFGSPCIDTGNPGSPLDPDGTRADMGALYYDHLTPPPPVLDVTLTPVNPPIIVQPGGGSFQFNAAVQRTQGPQTPFWAWARVRYPDGLPSTPTLGPVQVNPPVGVSVSRLRVQNIPGSWPPGVYTYLGYANTTYSYPAIDSSYFTFTKLATGSLTPWVMDASCTGDPFPYEVGTTAVASEFALVGAAPNPFNPKTTIRFTLPEAGQATLQVFDVNGREVATLVNGYRNAGTHQVTFDGSELASGMYLYTLFTGSHTATGKLLLVK